MFPDADALRMPCCPNSNDSNVSANILTVAVAGRVLTHSASVVDIAVALDKRPTIFVLYLQLAISRRGIVKRHERVAADAAWLLLPGRKGIHVPSGAVWRPAHLRWLRHV